MPTQPPIFISGATVTGTSAAVGLASLALFRSDTEQLMQLLTSDGSGLFTSNPVGLGITYQIDAYKAGTPDIAGTTRNDLAGGGSVTIYMRNPTAPDGGGSAVYPAVGDVDIGITYGPGGTDFTGTLVQPAVGDVRSGTTYGAGGTEFTGTLSVTGTSGSATARRGIQI